jgi:colanic acid/amylovoran biosynthesis protein
VTEGSAAGGRNESEALRACVLGASLDVGNRGVLALAVSVAQLIARARPGTTTLAFHYGNETGGARHLPGPGALDVQVFNCRLSPRSAPGEHVLVILVLAALYRMGVRAPARRNAWLRSLLDADLIGDITGGDSFSDIYGFRRFLTGSLPLISVNLLGRPYAMLPQTYGPFRSGISRRLGARLLRGAATILTRDKNCRALVQELCGRTPRFCPDVAFTLEPSRPSRLDIAPPGLDVETASIVGLNVSGLLYMGGYTGRNMFGLKSEYRELIDRLVDAILRTTDARLLLVPHVFGPEEQEEEASAAIQRAAAVRHPGRVFAVRGESSERELKWIIGRTQFFIGSRMHACIAALSQCVPAIGLAYSDKFLGVFQSAGVGEAIVDLRGDDTETVIARTLDGLARRNELRSQLTTRMADLTEEVRQTFRELVGDGRRGQDGA